MKTSVNLAGVELKNPVMTASGTFGSGAEYSEFDKQEVCGSNPHVPTNENQAVTAM